MSAPRNEATDAQVRAADPESSTWLAANAGSGKTRVLTDRVARLLLQGVDPQQVLCLTYTKAAASEMQNRLFQRLGAWAMLEDVSLRNALLELGTDGVIGPDALSRARTLFARAIETPGGLKIQTIHSFCAGLLRRFPLEAGVNPQFKEMEDRAAELLRADIVDAMATGPDAPLLRDLAMVVTGTSLDKQTADILKNRDLFATPPDWPTTAAQFNTSVQFGAAEIEAHTFLGSERALLDRVVPIYMAGSKKDVAMGTEFAKIQTVDAECLPILQRALLTQTGTIRAKLATNSTATTLGADLDAIADLAERLLETLELIDRHETARRSYTLACFAHPFLQHYEAAKRAQGWLDFDDLILRTRSLLSDPKVADWVLYRLDGGISHVLVDEAQDTSPAQWDVIRKLTQEFTSGLGARTDEARTLFVVGDKKQSIYSFQGADPDAFDEMAQEFQDKFEAVDAPFQSRSLKFSFRSSAAILGLVDATFEGQANAGFNPDQTHRAFHSDMPGRVDLLPLLEPVTEKEERDWTDPIDRKSKTHRSVLLANRIADQIADMLDSGTVPHKPSADEPFALRRIVPGDIMILVQTRAQVFHEIIRACKQRDLPIAGADRLRVGAELVVRDLLALLSFLATPEDSLSLATCLRSPLFGWSEQELFQLANGRSEIHLWQTLRGNPNRYGATLHVLHDLRGKIDFLRPYDLLERVLTRHGGRKLLLARLGQEAQDGIDALLSQALAYERNAVPSLTGFLTWAQADDLEIKRQVDSSGTLIRVMTVHGAKGLEAPIVFLPETTQGSLQVRDGILSDKGQPVWKPNKDAMPDQLTALIDAEKDKQARERLRLLYVAMTRAESWLIVASAGDLSKKEPDWYQQIERGLKAVGAMPTTFPGGPGLRHQVGSWDLPLLSTPHAAQADAPTVAPWMTTPVTQIPKRAKAVSPSDLGGSKALPSDQGLPEDIAKARGTYIHHMLEHLAGHASDQHGTIIAGLPVPEILPPDLVQQAQQEAIQVRAKASLDWIFAESALAEITVQGKINGHAVLGIIDRLIVTSDRVTAVDFKSNTAVPDKPDACPEGILRQMGAYADLLQQIYPDRTIETGILWTAPAEYMSLPHSLVSEALARAPSLDGDGACS